jgi:hypothetical protein
MKEVPGDEIERKIGDTDDHARDGEPATTQPALSGPPEAKA